MSLRVSRDVVLSLTKRGILAPRPLVSAEHELRADGEEWTLADAEPLDDAALALLASLAAERHDEAELSGADRAALARLRRDGYVRDDGPWRSPWSLDDVVGRARPPADHEPAERSPDDPAPAVPADIEPDQAPVAGSAIVGVPFALTFVPAREGFVFVGRGGVPVVLGVEEVVALSELVLAGPVATAHERLLARRGGAALRPDELHHLVRRGLTAGLLVDKTGAEDPDTRSSRGPSAWDGARRLTEQMEVAAAAYRQTRQRDTSRPKPAVVPIAHTAKVGSSGWHIMSPNLALGLIFSYADVYDDGRLHEVYDFELQWMARRRSFKRLLADHGPSVFLFSNYVWSLSRNLALSAELKALSPESLMVHGGPSTPKYADDARRFLDQHPHVDVIVRGEGEQTTMELLDALDGNLSHTEALTSVDGLTFRRGDQVVRTADRERLADLDRLPSPYLTGIFDGYANGVARFVILETNRGCPYGCTFCDWGSATLSRIRKFDTERVLAELEWVARNQVTTLLLADANFGIFERDVAFAERIVELKRQYGYPLAVTMCFAKNTAKHLQPIIEMFVANDILTEGNLALQSNDPTTLEAIERKNIKAQTYLDVTDSFRRRGLPLITDLMIGLPGSTVDSFAEDLQYCIDHQVTPRMVRLEVLVNSPMNDPEYRRRFAIVPAVEPAEIEGGRRALVLSTSSYTRADLGQMLRLRDVMLVGEDFGLLRHVALWVHHRTGRREIEFYRDVERACRDEPERWPLVLWLLRSMLHVFAPPLSRAALYDELGRLLVEELGVADDSELRCVLAVSEALMPTGDRRFPETVVLPHDYARWFHLAFDARISDPEHWRERTPSLSSFPSGRLTIDDPRDVRGLIDGSRQFSDGETIDGELRSEVSRTARVHHIEHVPAS